MSYLKIFPQSLTVNMDGVGGYVGRMRYDFEQYGSMIYADESDITLQCQSHEDWVIRSTGQMHRLTGFSVFIQSLNHYLFKLRRFDPVSQWCKVSAIDYEYYFERVYFDMCTRQFNRY